MTTTKSEWYMFSAGVCREDSPRGVPVDVVFLTDVSDSISNSLNRVNDFLVSVSQELVISSNDARVGIATYSASATTRLNLNAGTSRSRVADVFRNQVVGSGARTNTAGGIEHVYTRMFTESLGDREDVPNVLVLMSDGRSDDFNEAIRQANLAKSRGVEIITISISPDDNLRELSALATNPNSGVLSVTDVNNLVSLVNRLVTQICPTEPPDGECALM